MGNFIERPYDDQYYIHIIFGKTIRRIISRSDKYQIGLDISKCDIIAPGICFEKRELFHKLFLYKTYSRTHIFIVVLLEDVDSIEYQNQNVELKCKQVLDLIDPFTERCYCKFITYTDEIDDETQALIWRNLKEIKQSVSS